MRAEIYGCFAEELPPYNGTLTLTYLREREREGGLGREEMKKSKRGREKYKSAGRKLRTLMHYSHQPLIFERDYS